MKSIIPFAKKELIQLKRDPRLIGFLIFMPIMLMILFGYGLRLEPKNVKMAFVDNDKSYFSNLIKTNLWNEGYFELYEVSTKEGIEEEIRKGNAKAGLYIDKTFSKLLTDNAQPHVVFYVDGTMPSLTTAMRNKSSALNDDEVTNDMYFLDEDDTSTVIAAEPFIMDTEVLFNPDEKETWFFLPGVIGVLIMQIALILAGTSVVRERESNTLEQLLVSPLSKVDFILGKMFPYVLISLFEFYFILFIGWSMFEIPIPSSAIGGLVLLSVVYTASMISLGLLISTVSQTQQQAMFLAIFVIIPSILLAGFIFPIEAMHEYIRPIAYMIPFTYFVEIIRGLLIKQTLMTDMIIPFAALTAFSLLFTILSIIKFKRITQ